MPGNETAAICGLFCGTCPSYPCECEGCLSSKVAPECSICRHGFRDCSKLHNVTRCHECIEFPCDRLKEFSKMHIVNGICHHEHVIDDLNEMREIGEQAWVAKQVEEHTCSKCASIIPWTERTCPSCK